MNNSEHLTEQMITAYFDRLRSAGAVDAMIALARSINFDDFKQYTVRNSEIKIPVLIIWGENDKWVPLKIGHKFHSDIPGSVMVTIPECGHIPQEEYPELTAGYIVNFIEGRPFSTIGNTP